MWGHTISGAYVRTTNLLKVCMMFNVLEGKGIIC